MIQTLTDTKMMFRDRTFLKKALNIAFPVAMQGMLNTVVNLVDNLMIGSLGPIAIASVGLANKVFFVFTLLVFGVVSGSGVLAAQYWGTKDLKNIRKVLGIALLISLTGAVLFLLPARFWPEFMMRIFTTSEASIEMGAAYLAGLAVGYWTSREDVRKNWASDCVFEPSLGANERMERIQGWKRAVKYAYGWAKTE